MPPSIEKPALRETDLYAPIHDFLTAQGYAVQAEVKGCDVVATRGDEVIVIELKCSFSVALLIQATQRQRVADSVYVALPRPRGAERGRHWQHVQHLLRRLELGLIWVSPHARAPEIEVVCHPLPLERRRHTRVRRAILREVAGRSGSYNRGGSSRGAIVTAYRERALLIACCLAQHGPLSPSQLRAFGSGPKTQSILAHNFYGWFERVERGVYALAPEGRKALGVYEEVVSRLRLALEGAPPGQPCEASSAS